MRSTPPTHSLVWARAEYGQTERMVLATAGGEYRVQTHGNGIAYSLAVATGPVTPVTLADGYQYIPAPLDYDLWMARLDLPDQTRLNPSWRDLYDASGRLLNTSVGPD